MIEDYPKADKLLDDQQARLSSKIRESLYWPFKKWCDKRGHPKSLMKFTRMARPEGSDIVSWRSCRLCNRVYEQDVLTVLAILEREINAMEEAG